METLPIVDMQSPDVKDLSDEEHIKAVGEKVFQELKKHSFVYLKNHPVPESLLESTIRSARAFFALPLETKLKYNRHGKPDINGYIPPNSEIISRAELGDTVLELKEVWNTPYFGGSFPTEDVPSFGRDFVAMNASLEPLSLRVLAGLEAAIGRPGLLTDAHVNPKGERNNDLRAAYYPALPDAAPPGAVRCSTHSDYGGVTFLVQEACGGLEVLHRSGDWVPAPAVPGTLLVITGDMVEIWTGGEIQATKHRVLVPAEEELRRKDRLSLVYFCMPRNDALVVPPAGCEKYQPVMYGNYLTERMLAIAGDQDKLYR